MAKARNFEQSGQIEKAREIYEKLVARYPDQPKPYHRLGVVADRQRRHREAQALLTQSLRLDPRNAELLNDLGYCFYLQGKFSKAESALLKATALAPSAARYRNNLGMAYGHQGRYEEALNQFRRVGSEADAQYNLAFVLASQDQFEKAKNCFHLALAADPTHENALRALENFEKFEDVPESLLKDVDNRIARASYVPFVENGLGGGQADPVVYEADQSATALAGTSSQTVIEPRHAGAAIRAMREMPHAVYQRHKAEQGPATP